MARGRITVEVDAPCGLENAFHLKKSYRHSGEIYAHRFVVECFRRLNDLIEVLMLFSDFSVPFILDIFIGPDVFERRAFSG